MNYTPAWERGKDDPPMTLDTLARVVQDFMRMDCPGDSEMRVLVDWKGRPKQIKFEVSK